jgi:hypothetical protein
MDGLDLPKSARSRSRNNRHRFYSERSYGVHTTGLARYAGALSALALCSACASGSAVSPSTGAFNSTGLTTAARANLSAAPRFETILPDHHANAKTFEYVINTYGSYATIFDYPTSEKQFGEITDVGGQGCTNVLYGYGKKTFWIVARFNKIEEYKVPKKPIRALSTPASFGMPTSCAMNTNGDLAVGIFYGSSGGDVAIFKGATGSPTFYTTALAGEYFDGYDNQGNLFADGFTSDGYFALVELPKGGSKFETIATSNSVEFPGSVQWDGTYVTVTDQLANKIYQYTVSGTKATLEGTVSLTGSSDCAQTWIATGVVYCGDNGNNDGEVFNYPAGGSPIAVLRGSFDGPLGVVAAKK